MPTWAIALFLKPFIAFVFLSIALCGRLAVDRWMPDCKLKRLLLRRIS